MKKGILLFALVCTHLLLGQNLIENPGFEIGPTATINDQVDHANGWSRGCRWNYIAGNSGSPDLYDRDGYRSCFVENVLLPRVNGSENNRYVHMFNLSNDPSSGESIKGTIVEPLSVDYSYEVSCYLSRRINTNDDDQYQAPLQLEFVLRKNDNCELEKIVYTSTYINEMFYGNCSNLPSQPSTAWVQKKGSFNLDASDIAEEYNRLEIRIKGDATIHDPVFIDDVELKTIPRVRACFEIKNIDKETFVQSDYGPQSVKELCLPRIEIDGSCSENEDGYHIRISEFSMSPWGFVDDYYEGWVAAGTAPSTIDLTNLIGIPSANNGWTSRTFDPTKLYSVSLSVGAGNIWNSAPLQFFTVKNCNELKACFEIKNINAVHREKSDYGPQSVKELCLPKVEIDGSCSENEEGYHIKISEFSMSPWGFVDDYYEGWVATGTAPSTIDLANLIGTPSANNGWTSRIFDPAKLYSVSLGVGAGPLWNSAALQFFRVNECEKNELTTVEDGMLKIYPNPTQDLINLSFNKYETGTVTVYNFYGNALSTQMISKDTVMTFDMSTYEKGIYLVEVIVENRREIYKIVKE